MFYLLLIIPHVLGIAGLLAFAYWTGAAETGDDDQGPGDWYHDDGPPRAPEPRAPLGGLPLPHAVAPPRRLPVGGRLAELHPRPPRREREPERPVRPRIGA